MKKRSFSNIIFAFLIYFICVSCSKTEDVYIEDEDFCLLVSSQKFEETGPLINNFLSKLEKNKPDQNLEKLRLWLEAQPCVEKAVILCNSCIETLPAQSELSIDFVINGQKIAKVMDVLMSETLKFRTYHDY